MLMICDDVIREFEEFINTTVAENHSTFESFDPHEAISRVDVLLYESMAKNQHYRLVWYGLVMGTCYERSATCGTGKLW